VRKGREKEREKERERDCGRKGVAEWPNNDIYIEKSFFSSPPSLSLSLYFLSKHSFLSPSHSLFLPFISLEKFYRIAAHIIHVCMHNG
jgi:hypothetical protein